MEVKKYIKKISILFFLGIFILMAFGVQNEMFVVLDKKIYNLLVSFSVPVEFWKFISFLAGPHLIIATLIIALFLIKNKKTYIIFLINILNVFLLNQGLKILFSRPRPVEIMLVEEVGYSFPSGHAMMSLAFYGFLIYIIWKTKMKNKTKKMLTSILMFLILLIGISRICLGVHYPSDIIAGFVLSSAYLILFIKIIENKKRSDKNEKSV